jgi:hypothetical protein
MGKSWDEVIEKQEKAAAVSKRIAAEKALEESVNEYRTLTDKQEKTQESRKSINKYERELNALLSSDITTGYFSDSELNDVFDYFKWIMNNLNAYSDDPWSEENYKTIKNKIANKQDVVNLIKIIEEAFSVQSDDRFDSKNTEEILEIIEEYDEDQQKEFQEKLEEGIKKLKDPSNDYQKEISN